MRKIEIILFLAVLSTACSVFRKGVIKDFGSSERLSTGQLLEKVRNSNITGCNFYIQKAEIEIISPEGNEKLLGSIKYESPDKYLISIKSRSGIEAARILINRDTILVNDRINKKLYYGSTLYLKKKYDISVSALPVILGDFFCDNFSGNYGTEYSGDKLDISSSIDGISIKYVIDNRKGKTISAVYGDSMNETGLKIDYEDFINSQNVLTAGKINVLVLQRGTTIGIKFKKIESPWIGKIEFLPGNRYEKIQLK